MKRHFRWDRKYLNWGITAFCVIAAAILFYAALKFLPSLKIGLGKLFGILSPFLWGLGFTYLLAPLMKKMESFFMKPKGGKKRGMKPKTARSIAVIISLLFLLIIMTALTYLIIPQLYSSFETIITNSPVYFDKIVGWVKVVLADNPKIEEYVSDALTTFNDSLLDLLKQKVLPSLGNVVSNVTTGVYYVVIAIYNLIVGIIVSVYLLSSIEKVSAGGRKVLYSIFTVEAAEKIRRGISFIDRTFMGFIGGKLLDSAIIGLICYIVCALINMPYALLVSVIVGVTNIIPFFGPFIGAIPSFFIILLVNPLKSLIFVVFIIILQQVDGNIIGPKILGNSIGINGFWVMFAIILGAGLYGFWGMVFGVPVFAVIYTGLQRIVNRKLGRSDLPIDVADYEDLDYIDPITRETVKK